MISSRPKEGSERAPKKVTIVCDSQEKAIGIVQDFWNAMPHKGDLLRNFDGNWTQELTMGDRTKVILGRRDQKGKYIVLIQGNHQPLSQEAETWLRDNNYI